MTRKSEWSTEPEEGAQPVSHSASAAGEVVAFLAKWVDGQYWTQTCSLTETWCLNRLGEHVVTHCLRKGSA